MHGLIGRASVLASNKRKQGEMAMMRMRAVVVVVLLGASTGITAKSSVACKIVHGEEEQEGEREREGRKREGRKRERRTRNQNVSFMHHGCFNVIHLKSMVASWTTLPLAPCLKMQTTQEAVCCVVCCLSSKCGYQ